MSNIETPWIMQKVDPGDADIAYSARLTRRYTVDTKVSDEGVLDLTAWKVSQHAAGANFQVDVSVGRGAITGDDETRQGNYLGETTAVQVITVDAAPGSNSRYDIVVAKVRDEQAGGDAGGDQIFDVIAGTPSGSPAVPAVPDSCLLLAVIGPITSSTPSIGTALIHDAQTGTGPAEAAGAHRQAGDWAPAGSLREWAGPTSTVPNGWLPCDGSSVLRATYPRLFAVIGTTYGAVDGSHFTLLDTRGRATIGAGAGGGLTARTLAATGGEETHQLTTGELATHHHNVDPPNTALALTDPTHAHGVDPPNTTVNVSDPGHVHSVNPPSTAVAPSFPLVNNDVPNTTAVGVVSEHQNTYLNSSQAIGDVDIAPFNTASVGTGITAAVNIGSFASAAAGTGISGAVNIAAFDSADAGSNTAHNNMQPFVVVNRIIRT